MISVHRPNPFIPKLDRSSLPIVLWNLTPFIGVVAFGWAPISVFICYALETIVIGIFNVFKLIAVNYFGLPPASDEKGVQGLAVIPFFLVHYYMFVFIQLSIFFPMAGTDGLGPIDFVKKIFSFTANADYNVALGLFVVNNAYLFVTDFILPRAYEKRTVLQQMFEPYTRIFVQQFVVILGAMVYTVFGSGLFVLILLVVIKTWVDLLFYRKGLLEWAKEKQAEVKAFEEKQPQ
ncbi:MAG: DUF6498-containing protein [Chitinophagales bacterium]